MTDSVLPSVSSKAAIGVGVAASSLAYAASLVVQRVFPPLKEALALSLGGGVAPTYYLRVAASLTLGLAMGAIARKWPVREASLAWGTGLSIALSVVIICAFP